MIQEFIIFFVNKLSMYLMNCDSVHISVINKPNYLVREKFTIVLRAEVRLSRFRGIQLKSFTDTFSQDIQGWISFHDFSHGLLDQRLGSRKPVSISTKCKQIIFIRRIFFKRKKINFYLDIIICSEQAVFTCVNYKPDLQQ